MSEINQKLQKVTLFQFSFSEFMIKMIHIWKISLFYNSSNFEPLSFFVSYYRFMKRMWTSRIWATIVSNASGSREIKLSRWLFELFHIPSRIKNVPCHIALICKSWICEWTQYVANCMHWTKVACSTNFVENFFDGAVQFEVSEIKIKNCSNGMTPVTDWWRCKIAQFQFIWLVKQFEILQIRIWISIWINVFVRWVSCV